MYGFPLFEREDAKEAKDFFIDIHKYESDKGLFKLLHRVWKLSDKNMETIDIIGSNKMIVASRAHNHLLPPLIGYMVSKGIDCGVITYNPSKLIEALIDNCIRTRKAFSNESLRLMNYFFFDDFGSPTTWLEIDTKRLNEGFQQYITSKYSDNYVTKIDDKIYVKIVSEDTFCFLYSFADDIFTYL